MTTSTLTRALIQAQLTERRTHRRVINLCIVIAVICALAISFMTGQEIGWDQAHHKACSINASVCTKLPMDP